MSCRWVLNWMLVFATCLALASTKKTIVCPNLTIAHTGLVRAMEHNTTRAYAKLQVNLV